MGCFHHFIILPLCHPSVQTHFQGSCIVILTHIKWTLFSQAYILALLLALSLVLCPGGCFSKLPQLFEPISGTTIPFISSQRRGSKPSNFAILFIFLILKTCKKITFSKWADCSLTTSFLGPKSSWDFQETGRWYSAVANKPSALSKPAVITGYLRNKLLWDHVAGPYQSQPFTWQSSHEPFWSHS